MSARGSRHNNVALRSEKTFPYPSGNEPWLQQPQEPDMWYQRFKLFRDMGPMRTIPDLAKEIEVKERGRSGKSFDPGTAGRLYKAMRKYYWRERANAYDAYLEKIAIDETEQITKRVVRSQYELIERFTTLTLERVRTMSPDELSDPKDVIKGLETAIKMGSLVVGLPTERTESSSVSFTINLGDRDLNEQDNADDRNHDPNIIDIE